MNLSLNAALHSERAYEHVCTVQLLLVTSQRVQIQTQQLLSEGHIQ
jgi:hypothetical protein